VTKCRCPITASAKELGLHPETRVILRLEDCLDDMAKSRQANPIVSEVVSKVPFQYPKDGIPGNSTYQSGTINRTAQM